MFYVAFLLRTGRAVMYPVYKGTYERRVTSTGPNSARDAVIQYSKDLGRALDYLGTRPDIDSARLAFMGLSEGALRGPLLVAMEPRIRTAIFVAGGLSLSKMADEVDPFNFAPRVRVPVLMVNGRNDFNFPFTTSVQPMFRALGTSPDQKRLAEFEAGHVPPTILAMKDILDWLDRQFGRPAPKH
jgi:dipeptidyl aminopeptidase/acylaminoacyl peptidase